MNDTVTILSKEYIIENEIKEQIKAFSYENNLIMENEGEDTVHVFQEEEDGFSIGITFGILEKGFNKEKGTYQDLASYALIILISFSSGDCLLVPFLKAFVKKYPDILVYNDELIDFNKETYRIYNKQDIEETIDDDYWSLLGKKL